MPNHITNILKFTGDKEKIKEMFEVLKGDEVGFGSIDFNKVIPMPPSLNIEAGSTTDRGLKAYRDFIEVYTLMGTREDLNLLNIPKESEEAFLKARTDIDKDIFEKGKVAFQNKIKYGAATWYDWSIENWGTKWNSYGYENLNAEDVAKTGTTTFDTAWSAPVPVLQKIAEMYPDFEIEHQWADEDIGQNCGRMTYKNGERIEEYYPETDVEAIEFAVAVKGYDSPLDFGLALNADKTAYIPVWNEEYDLIEVNGVPALFSNNRIADSEVPFGLYRYDLRHSDDGDRFVSIEPNVLVNNGGSIIVAETMDFGESGSIELTDDTDPNFIGDSITIADFMQGKFDMEIGEMGYECQTN